MFDWLITGFNWIIDHTFGYLYQLVCYLLCLILPENFTRIIRPISETETKVFQDIFWNGIKSTMAIALIATAVGFLIAIVFGTLRTVKVKENDHLVVKILKHVMQFFLKTYITIFRGTPMMVQSMIIYYGLVGVLKWTPFNAALIIVSINSGAYLTEVIKEAILSVDHGQTEAARSLGFGPVKTLFYVVFPQAIKNCMASIGNEFIINIKDTSVLNVIGCAEMFFVLKQSTSIDYMYTQQMIVGAIFYLILTSLTSLLLHALEKKVNAPVKPLAGTN